VSRDSAGGGEAFRAAIVGAGGIGRIHALLIEQLGGRVAAVCSRTLEGARALGRGNPYDDLGALLRAERPDVVHVCSPNPLHAEHALAALAAGAHVFCEKPLGITREEALRMVEAADRAGRIGAVGFCYRGYPVIQELRHAVAEGRYGRLRRVSGEYLSADLYDPAKYVWHFTHGLACPSLVLLDYGVHWLDLVEHVTGQRIVEIQARLSTHQPRRVWRGGPGEGPRPAHGKPRADGGVEVEVELDEQADLLFRLSGDAAGSATFFALSPGNPNHIAFSMDGSAGGFDWCQETADLYVDRSRGEKATRHRDPARLPAELQGLSVAPAGHPEGYLDAYRNVIASAWRAMRGEPVAYPSFADGCRGNALVDAAVESARSRRPVEPKD
jgi:predicted dehydrogenase